MADTRTGPGPTGFPQPAARPRPRQPADRRGRSGPLLGEASAAADRRLVGACLAGDEDAWCALVDRYKSLVYSIILEVDRGRDDPAALFVTAWRAICDRLSEPGPRTDFCGWLVTLTLEACGLSAEHAVERTVGRLVELQRLRWCLEELPSPCREALLHHLSAEPDGCGERTARRLGIPAADWPAFLGVCLERLHRGLIRHGLL